MKSMIFFKFSLALFISDGNGTVKLSLCLNEAKIPQSSYSLREQEVVFKKFSFLYKC